MRIWNGLSVLARVDSHPESRRPVELRLSKEAAEALIRDIDRLDQTTFGTNGVSKEIRSALRFAFGDSNYAGPETRHFNGETDDPDSRKVDS